jgi:hypothetical protein
VFDTETVTFTQVINLQAKLDPFWVEPSTLRISWYNFLQILEKGRSDCGKHSSLLRCWISHGRKRFYETGPKSRGPEITSFLNVKSWKRYFFCFLIFCSEGVSRFLKTLRVIIAWQDILHYLQHQRKLIYFLWFHLEACTMISLNNHYYYYVSYWAKVIVSHFHPSLNHGNPLHSSPLQGLAPSLAYKSIIEVKWLRNTLAYYDLKNLIVQALAPTPPHPIILVVFPIFFRNFHFFLSDCW